MKKNVGNIDKLVRIIFAFVLVGLAWKGGLNTTLSYVLYAIAVIMLIVAFIGYCPAYPLIGSICKKKQQ